MKFGQLIKYYVRNFFLQKSCRKSGRKTLSSRSLFVNFLNTLYYIRLKKQVASYLVLVNFGGIRYGVTIKTKLKTFPAVDPDICSILIFYKKVWD